MFKIWLCTLLTLAFSCPSPLCSCPSATCSACLTSFAFLSNSTCIPCPIECATCSSSSCLSCRPNYYLTNFSCLLCPLNCQTCSASPSLTCSQCINGYALVQNECLPCNDANALTCQSPTTVSACASGYWENGNSCSPCREFCLLCSSSSNCFQCKNGYQVSVSFGSYCSSCPANCRSCSGGVCSQCFYNYQLVNGVCYDITQNCSSIAHCVQCTYENASVYCRSCRFPYYISNGYCILGSSLLCQNGSIGPMYYQCLDYCSVFSYQTDSFNEGIVCQPNSWVSSNEQLYFNAFSSIFSGMTDSTPFETVVNNPTSDSLLSFSLLLTPYYKLQVYFKSIAFPYQNNNTLSYVLADNRSNSESHSYSIATATEYISLYHNFTTKAIQDQSVSIYLKASRSDSIIGLSQALIVVFACPDNCRLCYNKELCLECYEDFFNTPDNTCANTCTGYIELYLPDGNPSNYTHKSCVLQCPAQFYTAQNSSNYICLKCSGNCVTCLDESECLSCVSPLLYYEINYTCLSICPNTHFSRNSTCQPCNAPCETCLDASTCLTCSVGYLTNNRCESTCPSGTYQNSLDNSCSPCDDKCTACIGSPTYCLSCNSPYLLLESSCVLNCTFGLYYQSNQTCQQCVVPCRQCSSQSQCLSCAVGYLFDKQCLSECPNQYYADSFNGVCLPCSNDCLTCLSASICLSCPNSTNLYSYSCYLHCPINTYSSTGICLNCLLPCENCLNQTYCTSCSIGYLSQISSGLCVSQCENGFFGFDLNRTCLACTNNCQTCTLTSYLCSSCPPDFLLQNSACVTSCAVGFFNLSGSCYACTYPCTSCLNNDYSCTSCANSYILISNSCSTECPSNNFQKGSSCEACLPPCASCLSETDCMTCLFDPNNQTFLYGTVCITTCPSATFADSVSLLCRNCIYPCEDCLSEEICLSCATGYLDPTVGTCSICPDTMFANDTSRQCQKCSVLLPNCLICLSAVECSQCMNGYYLYNSSCIASQNCTSLIYFYIDYLLQTCSRCSPPCSTCLNESFCTSCALGYLLNGNCLAYCPSNYYRLGSACFACEPPCLTCSNNVLCLSCNTSSEYSALLVANSTCIFPSECPSGSYISSVLSEVQCLKCSLPCLTCTNSTFCLSCFSGILISGSCKSLCPSTYYANTSITNLTFCSECSSNCFKCTKSADYCTSCNANLYLRNNTCVNNCGNGYYLDQTVLECFECLLPCGNCSSLSTCLDCQNSSFILYYGECLTSCPDGSYSNHSNCLNCPSSCLTCHISNGSLLCISCNFGLFMSSKTEGLCVSNCSSIEYGDILTRNCYSCIAPCVSCTDAIHCLSCQPLYLLYNKQCLKINRCPDGSFLLDQSCITSCGTQWADTLSAKCINSCQAPFLKAQQNNSKNCLAQCPSNYRVDVNYSCLSCVDGHCSNLLGLKIQYKNIFNILYLKLTFNQKIDVRSLSPSMLSIALKTNSQSRLLAALNLTFQISSINLDALWLQLSINQSLRAATIAITFSDYYIFQKPLQGLSYSIIVTQFDYYTPQESANGSAFETFAEVMSIVMVFFFIVNLCLNSGHLSYSIIDYYQLLFMVLFLSIDFSPQLNNFLYGFRYSHFFFLPQIFRTNSENRYTTTTPDQFGVIVPDVNFINNTGQDFIIIFATVGILLICKVVEVCLVKIQLFRSNKVRQSEESEGKAEEEREQDQRCIVRLVRAVISRFKWNYFNDIVYSIYFSIMLFAFSQLYDLQTKQSTLSMVSILFAFLFLLLGIIFPFFLAWFLFKNEKHLIKNSLEKQKQDYLTKKMEQSIKETAVRVSQQKQKSVKSHDMSSNKSKEDEQLNKFQILTDYKCFVSGIKLRVRLAFYQIPIKFGKKLILAALLVYCSSYPSFVLGVIMMFCFINILITVALKPYRLSFQQIIYPIFDALYLIIFFIICAVQLPVLNLTKDQKLKAGYTTISLCTILSFLLAVHNIVLNIVEVIKYFCNVDYFSKYYQTEYVSTSEESDHLTQQGTNTPLKKEVEDEQQMTGSQIFSGLDIYLKKESTAPKFLIKCVKQEEEKMSEQENIPADKLFIDHYDFSDHNLRESHERMGSAANQTSKDISYSNKQMAERIVKGIQPINFDEQSEQSQ